MFTIESFSIDDTLKATAAFEIRRKVFVEEQQVDQREEYDAHEQEARHYLIYKDDIPVGTARWRSTDKGIKLERFAVLPEYRKSGAGSMLVSRVLDDVVPFNKKIYLHSQVAAMNLYSRAGFEPEGELFYEANIPHYRMVFKRQ
jgi:predicted GNAT family N-acyltransferase